MKPLYTTLLTAALLTISGNAQAETKPLFDFDDKERWIIRLRAIDVQPDESSTVSGLAANVEADNRIVPELDFTYFFTDNIGAELILATTKHDMSTDTGIDLGSVWIIPPHFNLQYHFNPEGTFRPYAGAGVGYMYYYNEDSGAVNDISYKSGMSYSL